MKNETLSIWERDEADTNINVDLEQKTAKLDLEKKKAGEVIQTNVDLEQHVDEKMGMKEMR